LADGAWAADTSAPLDAAVRLDVRVATVAASARQSALPSAAEGHRRAADRQVWVTRPEPPVSEQLAG